MNQAVIKSKKSTIIQLLIESFFAILPLVVLGFAWPGQSKDETRTFVATPEWSLTACVFYGLALARLQLAATVPLRSGAEHRALGLVVLSLLPLLGVIASVITITEIARASPGIGMVMFQIVNLACSLLAFFVIGGYGINRSSIH